jgi:hypothetical protein
MAILTVLRNSAEPVGARVIAGRLEEPEELVRPLGGEGG